MPSVADNIELGEQDLEYLNQYLASTCFTLLNVNKDLFYKELHEPVNQATLKTFACDKKQRALLIAKVDKSKAVALIDGDGKPIVNVNQPARELDAQNIDGSSGDLDDPFRPIELRFSLKVQYLGQTAHTIAFLKRETYQTLELKP